MKKELLERAAKLSSQIDQDLKRDLARQREARKREVKGKSTLQKQFQLYYASKTLDLERRSWTPVVYFNVIKALRMIFAEVEMEMGGGDKGVGSGSGVGNVNGSGGANAYASGSGSGTANGYANANGKGNGYAIAGSSNGHTTHPYPHPHHSSYQPHQPHSSQAYASSSSHPHPYPHTSQPYQSTSTHPHSSQAYASSSSSPYPTTPSRPSSSTQDPQDLLNTRHKLLPLLSLESAIASELSGGVAVAGGRGGA
ncbi:hypothetical protein CVT24_008999, partial [Panaeolus cyanescens]